MRGSAANQDKRETAIYVNSVLALGALSVTFACRPKMDPVKDFVLPGRISHDFESRLRLWFAASGVGQELHFDA